ncbi:MAG: glycosyltransferase family 2 protein [Chloroflexi bacterium]|nr:glycosyltransferase family 2 protein [Chloroflexota bacterium]
MATLVRPDQPGRTDISVAIVSYNVCHQLEECLDSLRTSVGEFTYEVWVVDNASADGTAEMVRSKHPEVGLIASPYNGGFAYANNLALKRSRGRYALLLNPDTILPPTALADMQAYMEHHPEAGVAGPKLIRPDGSLDLACRRSFPTPSVSLFRMLGLSKLFPKSRLLARYNLTFLDPDEPAEVDSVCGAFMMVRSEAIAQVGLLDERFFMYGEDIDWALRIKARGWKVLYYPGVQVIHHKGASSHQSRLATRKHFYQAMRLFYHKHYWQRYPALLNWLVMGTIHLYGGLALLIEARRDRITTTHGPVGEEKRER